MQVPWPTSARRVRSALGPPLLPPRTEARARSSSSAGIPGIPKGHGSPSAAHRGRLSAMLIAAWLSVSVTRSILPETDDEIDSLVAAPTTRQWRSVRHPLVRVDSAGASNWTRNNPKRPELDFSGQAGYSSIQARRKNHPNFFLNWMSFRLADQARRGPNLKVVHRQQPVG